mmetsp:Transcript_146794/g.381506  ORF Transcript_146794/g.381506 Transcript_146794/m.381506 type:complete len:259 (-) Transcript_146794:399-1175(-)
MKRMGEVTMEQLEGARHAPVIAVSSLDSSTLGRQPPRTAVPAAAQPRGRDAPGRRWEGHSCPVAVDCWPQVVGHERVHHGAIAVPLSHLVQPLQGLAKLNRGKRGARHRPAAEAGEVMVEAHSFPGRGQVDKGVEEGLPCANVRWQIHKIVAGGEALLVEKLLQCPARKSFGKIPEHHSRALVEAILGVSGIRIHQQVILIHALKAEVARNGAETPNRELAIALIVIDSQMKKGVLHDQRPTVARLIKQLRVMAQSLT